MGGISSSLHVDAIEYQAEQKRKSPRTCLYVPGERAKEEDVRLLVVEDHPDLGPDLKAGLEECHYAVDLVANGEDAVALASLVPYDLLILDILLPDLNGWEVCRRLRAQHCQVPIVFLTALG